MRKLKEKREKNPNSGNGGKKGERINLEYLISLTAELLS